MTDSNINWSDLNDSEDKQVCLLLLRYYLKLFLKGGGLSSDFKCHFIHKIESSPLPLIEKEKVLAYLDEIHIE